MLLLLFALCCEDSEGPHGGDPRFYTIIDSLEEANESEAAALWLSGELTAPDTLRENLLSGYRSIRNKYREKIPQLDEVIFVPPWVPGELLIELSESAVRALRLGEYHDLDSLNTLYGVVEIDTNLLDFIGWVYLKFEDSLHPKRLAEYYGEIESVEDTSPNSYVGGGNDNYPWLIHNGISCLFKKGWGDCPAGCINNRFWYFKVYEDHVDYIGTFVKPADPYPSWWNEARVAYEAKRGL